MSFGCELNILRDACALTPVLIVRPNKHQTKADWRFATADAHIKLKSAFIIVLNRFTPSPTVEGGGRRNPRQD